MNDGVRGDFDDFLEWLHPNRDAALERHKDLRRKLVAFFTHHGCAAQDCASECLLRLASRKHWEDIQDIEAYTMGIANIVKAQYLSGLTTTVEIGDGPEPPPNQGAQSLEDKILDSIDRRRKLACASQCLKRMPPSNRSLFIAFHSCDREENIETRKRIADKLEISSGALRTRICRIRQDLEECVRSCCAETRHSLGQAK